MDILFKRDQTPGKVGRVNFKLWCKIELDEEEQALASHYQFENAILIESDEQALIRRSAYVGVAAFFISTTLFFFVAGPGAFVLGLIAGIGAGFWYFNEKRETILVSDVIHGRNFKCKSVIDLAKKESELAGVIAALNAVLASAKNWDGDERHKVELPSREEAKQLLASL